MQKNTFLTPELLWCVFLIVFEVRTTNSGYSFDVEFLKLLVLIDLFIMNM